MYSIYLDGNLVWTNETPEVGIYAAKISLKDNSTQTLEISVAGRINDPFKDIKMLQTVIDVYEDNTDGEPIFEGRAVNRKTDFYGNVTYQFEGVLGYLYDSIQPPAVYTGQTVTQIFTALINEHNSQVESFKQFVVGNVTVYDKWTDSSTYSGQGRLKDDDPTELPNYIYQRDSNDTGIDQTELTTGYESTFDAINNLLVQNLKGHLIVRFQNGVKYLDYLEGYLPSEGQTILFGSNLLDYSSTLDYSKICTGVLPLGYSRGTDDYSKTDPDNPEDPAYYYQKQDDPLESIKSKLTIASVNGGSKILWSEEAVANYGKIVKMVEWSNIKDAQKLYDKAKKYLLSTQFDNLSLECKVVDLHFLDPSVGPLHHLHMVRVKSEPNGMDRSMPISEMDIDLLNPANDSVVLGATYNSISGELADNSNNLSAVTGAIGDVSTTISNNNSKYWTNISKTDRQILLEAHSREQSVNELNQTIDGKYDAVLQITSKQISSEVSARESSEAGIVSDYNSKITQTAQQIQSTVNDNVNNLQTQITQNATSISTKVSNNDFSSKWTQTAEGFTWDADKINFTGKTISMSGTNINLVGGKITASTDDGFVKVIDGKEYKVISQSSFKDTNGNIMSVSEFIRKYAADEAQTAIDNNINATKGSGSKLRQGIRDIVEGYFNENIKSGYISKTEVSRNYVTKSTYDDYVKNHSYTNKQYENKKTTADVNTKISGAENAYSTYASLQARKNELVDWVKDLRAQVRAGCAKGTTPVH